MNEIVPAAMLSTQTRLRERVGYTRRSRKKVIQAAVAAVIFERYGHHIAIDLRSEENLKRGLDTVWEYLAYHNPMSEGFRVIDGATEKQRYESVSLMKRPIERGFRALQRHIRKDHGDRPVRLYMTSTSPDGAGAIEVITLNPDFSVSGATVRDLFEKRHVKQVSAKVSTFLNQADTASLRRQAIASLEGVVAMAKQLPEPVSQLRLEFPDDGSDADDADDIDVPAEGE